MTPNSLLEEFFERIGHKLLSLNWRKLGEWQIEPMLMSLGLLPREAQDQVESALGAIFELSCDAGWQTIVEAARQSGQSCITAEVPEGSSTYERAMWVWLRRPDLFEQALLMHQVDHLTRWRKRTGLPAAKPRITPDSIRELSIGLSHCLRHEEGRGQACTVDYFRRRDGADVFVAYPDDFVQTVMMHDEGGQLVPRSIRHTFEIVFAYHQNENWLHLFAQVASSVKPKLETLFGQIILGIDIGPQPSHRRFDLNRLKDRYFSLETDPSDRVSASIRKLRLDVPHFGRLTVEPRRDDRGGDVYAVIDECLNDQTVSMDDVEVSLATIRFEFEPLGSRRGGSLSFDVAWPDRCSIKSNRPERIELTRKYLRRWRIADV
jgi:hypothetical protein